MGHLFCVQTTFLGPHPLFIKIFQPLVLGRLPMVLVREPGYRKVITKKHFKSHRSLSTLCGQFQPEVKHPATQAASLRARQEPSNGLAVFSSCGNGISLPQCPLNAIGNVEVKRALKKCNGPSCT
jgi:hypothetical protein